MMQITIYAEEIITIIKDRMARELGGINPDAMYLDFPKVDYCDIRCDVNINEFIRPESE